VSEASIRGHPAREKWNERFGAAGVAPAQGSPSEWLVGNEALLRAVAGPGRRALDVACGSGRNALYLATLGFEVDALDISDERSTPSAKRRGHATCRCGRNSWISTTRDCRRKAVPITSS